MKTLSEHIKEVRAELDRREGEMFSTADTGQGNIKRAAMIPVQQELAALLSCERGRFEGELVEFDDGNRKLVSRCYRTIGAWSVVSVDGIPSVIETDKLRSAEHARN